MIRSIVASMGILLVFIVVFTTVLTPLMTWFRTLGMGGTTALLCAIGVIFGIPLVLVWILYERL